MLKSMPLSSNDIFESSLHENLYLVLITPWKQDKQHDITVAFLWSKCEALEATCTTVQTHFFNRHFISILSNLSLSHHHG